MALNSSGALIIEDRRREVAILRRRRLTVRQIADALQKLGRVNPRSGGAWDIATVQRDLDALRAEARREALRETSEHKAEILADLDELMRLAWAEKRYEDVRKLLRDKRDLLGTDAPQVVVFEQVAARMDEALAALEKEFAHDPDVLQRAFAALMGGQNPGARPVN